MNFPWVYVIKHCVLKLEVYWASKDSNGLDLSKAGWDYVSVLF